MNIAHPLEASLERGVHVEKNGKSQIHRTILNVKIRMNHFITKDNFVHKLRELKTTISLLEITLLSNHLSENCLCFSNITNIPRLSSTMTSTNREIGTRNLLGCLYPLDYPEHASDNVNAVLVCQAAS